MFQKISLLTASTKILHTRGLFLCHLCGRRARSPRLKALCRLSVLEAMFSSFPRIKGIGLSARCMRQDQAIVIKNDNHIFPKRANHTERVGRKASDLSSGSPE